MAILGEALSKKLRLRKDPPAAITRISRMPPGPSSCSCLRPVPFAGNAAAQILWEPDGRSGNAHVSGSGAALPHTRKLCHFLTLQSLSLIHKSILI